jgi:hypothetical protein
VTAQRHAGPVVTRHVLNAARGKLSRREEGHQHFFHDIGAVIDLFVRAW